MLIFGLLALCTAVALIFWLIGRPWAEINTANSDPFWWPWIVALSQFAGRFITWNMQYKFNHLKNKSGLSERWQITYWYTARVLLACLLGGLFALLALLLALEFKFLLTLFIIGAGLGYIWPVKRLSYLAHKRKLIMQRELPFLLDLLTLSVEAGLSLPSALQLLAKNAPTGPLRHSLATALALERTGMERSEWLKQWAKQTDLAAINNLVIALIQADKTGMNLSPVLKSQAQKQRSDRFLRAETMALQAPVKMLFPMVICIFPCTFLIIAFPIVVKLFDAGF